MHVVSVVGANRGTGGTTIAAWLAYCACAAEPGPGPVVGLDAGGDSTLLDWARGAGLPRFVAAAWDASCTARSVRQLGDEGVGLVLIDCNIWDGDAKVFEVLEASDLVLIVVQPLGQSLESVGKVLDIFESVDRQFVFVVNQATDDEEMTASSVISLAQYGTVSPVILPRYEDCGLPDRAAFENGGGHQVAMLENANCLWSYLWEGLERHNQPEPYAEIETGKSVEEWKYDRPATFVVPAMVYPCHVIDITSEGILFVSDQELVPGARLRVNLPYVGQVDCEVSEAHSGTMRARFVIDEERRAELLEQVSLLVEYGRERGTLAAA